MTRRALARAAPAIVALGLAGCPFHPRAPVPATVEGEWARERDANTRRALLYDGLKHRATGTATLLSLPVREARARRLAEWFSWTPVELEAELAKERLEAERGEEFVLSFYTADLRDADLDAPRSVWRVAVRVDGADLLASRVTSVESDATILGLYPYVGPFETVYRVLLPRAPGGPLAGREFVLEISSARGKLVLDFGAPYRGITPFQPVPAP